MEPVEQYLNTELAGRDFWEEYWRSRGDGTVRVVDQTLKMADLVEGLDPPPRGRFLELGGFPGYYSVYFAKFHGCASTLVDYYIDRQIIERLCEHNGVNGISVIEENIFRYTPAEPFDTVLSFGLIEHFQDPDPIIRLHADFVRPGGYVIIGIPNFRGLNGLLQWFFDRKNLSAHNLRTMRVSLLRELFAANGLDVVRAGYYDHFGLALEKNPPRGVALRFAVRAANALGTRLCRPFESRIFSPFLVVIGRKRKNSQ